MPWQHVKQRFRQCSALIRRQRVQIKFFIKIEDFEVESALYRDPDISATLPRVLRGSTNENGAQRSPSGCVCLRYLTGIHCWNDTAVVAYGSCMRRVHLLAGALRCERDLTKASSKYLLLCHMNVRLHSATPDSQTWEPAQLAAAHR